MNGDHDNTVGECPSATNLSANQCVLCRIAFDHDRDVAYVNRGLDRLVEYSEKYGDVELNHYLLSKPEVVKVHNSCRRNYTSKRRYEQKCQKVDGDSSTVKVKALRSSSETFNWKMHCFLCGQPCIGDKLPVKAIKSGFRRVETIEVRDTLLAQCTMRGDAWGLEVQGRLLTCCDLVAEEAIYHRDCHRDFCRAGLHATCGRPVDTKKIETFDRLCEWLELNDNELLTLQDVVTKAETLVPHNDEVYSEKWLKQKLKERYGDHIQFNEVRGRRNVICWKDMASYIVNEQWHSEQKGNDEVENIIVKAAKLLRATICENSYKMDFYPSEQDLQQANLRDWMPSLLQLFLDHLIHPEEKKSAIGHCIIQSVRPRTVIAPIPLAISISVDHICASKYLINLLHRLGMCSSYDEVRCFKQSVAYRESTKSPSSYPQGFVQFAADNVDHDVCTLNGSGTLHAMGIISITSCSANEQSCVAVEEPVARVKRQKSADVAEINKIPLPKNPLASIQFKPYCYAAFPSVLPLSVNLDTLWHLGWFLHSADEVRPSWAGFNSSVLNVGSVQASVIRLQPIIDRNPNDSSCIYSTLTYIRKECEKMGITTPVITFDQPLWLKAVSIVSCYHLDVVCRLGTFHLQMSFLGSLGTLMACSGLSEIMECCYGPITVRHIMAGKAVSRAVRAHLLVEAALTIRLLKLVLESDWSGDVSELQAFYIQLIDNGYDGSSDFPPGLFHIEDALAQLKSNLALQSRTARLWVQYLYYVSTLKLLLRAERTADWHLHLVSIRRMLNLFAASGHTNYAKCARLYIEMMTDLPVTHPALYEQFMSGAHIARRSNKFWGGLSIDLTIEQALMRAIKGHGGLTHGRGVMEGVRNTWVATVHKTAAVKSALAQFADIQYCHDLTQHPELGKSRAKRDNCDLIKLLHFLECHDPFQLSDSRLHSLTFGIAPSESDGINCDEAEKVGAAIMHRINGLPFSDVHLKRKDQVRTLAHVTNAATSGGKKHLSSVDPTILFHRLLVIMQRSADMKHYFSYELSAQPTSLFKDNFMRKTDKSHLAKEVRQELTDTASPPQQSVPVVDGGYLLHVVTWLAGVSYADVAQQYVQYVGKQYGHKAIVVFDGYCNGPSTKDHEHQRRAHRQAPNIVVEPAKAAYRDQSAFLANDGNKCALVTLIISSLKSAGHTVYQAEDDADTLVVKVALELAASKTVVSVIANDTDILIMLIAHYRSHMSDIFMYAGSATCVSSIAAIAENLGEFVTRRLLVIHAISGCDTTSCLFGHGKISVFRKLSRHVEIQPLFDILESSIVSQQEVMAAGCKILTLLYAGNTTDTLNYLRFKMYIACSSNQFTASST